MHSLGKVQAQPLQICLVWPGESQRTLLQERKNGRRQANDVPFAAVGRVFTKRPTDNLCAFVRKVSLFMNALVYGRFAQGSGTCN